ncbi:lipopolysaccharide biosynthesis protein [Paraflavitalea speifideaquila]|uniref:lipopolysaccharide biosynthesis protein n=1 Tax=Paraflavitalea speifideaquila TaxID=3076558 RepID=UPI0028E7D24C|nr:lipopolysaccharide biosynthesis protein [Paraflavitalea speifideiaquila]
MGQIRKQVIQSSFLSYIGFGVGAINTYFFTRQGIFTPEQYGLTQVIISLSQILAPLAGLGMTAFINRFFPYYFGHLEHPKNDMLTIAIIFSGIGAILVFGGCILFEPWMIGNFKAKSPLLVEFYYWALVFAFFYLCFTILESYMGALKKTVLPNFMKETAYRLCVFALIILYLFQVISFGAFVILFCCIYLLIVTIIVSYLFFTKQLYIATSFSPVSRRLRKSVRTYVGYVFTSTVIINMARQVDTLALAGKQNLATTGIYSLNQFAAAILQVPFRGLQAIAGPLIAEHWKSKNLKEIKRIYERSSINLLLIGSFLFINIWLNYDDGLKFLHIDGRFADGKTVFLLLGLCNLYELGTGTNAILIITSPAWRFELYAGVVLLALSIPLNIYMAAHVGMDGVALATAGTLFVYNSCRLVFIRYRFNLTPFTIKTLYALLLVAGSYLLTWFLLQNIHGLVGILARSAMFSALFFAGVFYFQLTPDLPQFIAVVRKRLSRKNNLHTQLCPKSAHLLSKTTQLRVG